MNERTIESAVAIDEPSAEIAAAEPAAQVELTPDEIQERMVATRRQIDECSDEVVTRTKELTDWRFHFQHHPWVSLTAAAVIGYAIVPGQAKTTDGFLDDHGKDSKADLLKSVLAATAKRAAMAHLSKTLGDVFGGFFTADDETRPATEGDDDE